LDKTKGTTLQDWAWGHVHRITYNHPLGQQKPFNWLFNVGPYPVPGTREVPNNFSTTLGPAPWPVTYGPSTRRVIDFADANRAQGINALGQSGVLFDRHYADQAARFVEGIYAPMHLSPGDVDAHTKSTLTLRPKP
jgi:penicillin amidase